MLDGAAAAWREAQTCEARGGANADGRAAPPPLPPRALECGCGAGNTAFPLLELAEELHPGMPLRVSAFDFAPNAVRLVTEHERYDPERVDAFVCDLASEGTPHPLVAHVGAGNCHAATLVFVLSALSPQSMPRALAAIGEALAPGAVMLVRDYAAGDLAEERFVGKGGGDCGSSRQLGERFYVRGDGTRAYFFERDKLVGLVERHAGLRLRRADVQERKIENRKMGMVMERRWLQAVFEKPTTFRGE